MTFLIQPQNALGSLMKLSGKQDLKSSRVSVYARFRDMNLFAIGVHTRRRKPFILSEIYLKPLGR